MSKSNEPTKYNRNIHPYWKYGWWAKHGDKDVRRQLEKRFRRATKRAIFNEKPCPTKPDDPKWIWW